jgi:hypothetical protein
VPKNIQHQREGQPVPDDVEHAAALTDACRDQSGADVEQQQLSVERESRCGGSVNHDHNPCRNGDPPGDRQPTFACTARFWRARQHN